VLCCTPVDAQLQALSADIQNIAIDSNAAQSLQITRNQKLQNILGKNVIPITLPFWEVLCCTPVHLNIALLNCVY